MNLLSLKNILEDNTVKPPDIIQDGILTPQSLLLIAGKQKARKSFLAYNFALGISQGHPFSIFKIIQPKKVIMFSAEGGYFSNRERLKTMCSSIENNGNDNLHFIFDSRLKIDIEEDYDSLSDFLREHKPEVLILDPFIKFHKAEENSSKEMGVVLDRLRNLIEDFKLSIILVHHLGKNPGKGARGSSVILGEYDSCITLSKSDIQNFHTIDFDLRHSITPSRQKIKFNHETAWFEDELSDLQKIISESGPLGRNELMQACLDKGLYKSDGGAYKQINKEIELGKLIFIDEKIFFQRPN